MEIIARLWGKSKEVLGVALEEWGVFLILFLTALASFGLGRLSAFEEPQPPVAILDAPAAARPPALALGGLIVASRTGSVYYFPWCSGAEKIAVGNQVWFASEAAARKAGYAPAKACEGLSGT